MLDNEKIYDNVTNSTSLNEITMKDYTKIN